MKNGLILILIYICVLTSCEQITKAFPKSTDEQQEKVKSPHQEIAVNYPLSYRDSTSSDNYYGKQVKDPYRWLEDIDAPATQKWITQQNQITFDYFDKTKARNIINKRLEKVYQYEYSTLPFRVGKKYYYFKNNDFSTKIPSGNTSKVLYSQEIGEEPEVLLDLNPTSTTNVSNLGEVAFSKDGSLMAYQVFDAESDWSSILIKDMYSMKNLEEEIKWVKSTNISWFRDGFYYCRYPAPNPNDSISSNNQFQQVYYHKAGTPQSDDELVFADRAHPEYKFDVRITRDERFLLVDIGQHDRGNVVYFKKLTEPNNAFIPIDDSFRYRYKVIQSYGNYLLVLTNYNAPNGRLVKVWSGRPEKDYWETVIPESEDILKDIHLADGKLVATYIHNASSRLEVFDMSGYWYQSIPLPEIGTVTQISSERNETALFYEFTSFMRPKTIYEVDMRSDSLDSSIFKAPNIDFQPEKYVTKQLWYHSYDGEKIPMFITHKKGLKVDGNCPTLLYAYGGFEVSTLPEFNLTRLNLGLAFVENNGIFAVANIRGGGEFGAKWYKAGTQANKQKSLNDFQAGAESLIASNYTNSEKLAIYGRANGGLVVGATIVQRPDLFKVAIPDSGVLDMLRYHKYTIGSAWVSDYGRSDDPIAFDYLVAYSPLHNIETGQYPAVLALADEQDKRILPAHSFKFISELQVNQKGANPVLIRVDKNIRKSKLNNINKSIDILSFAFYNLNENVTFE